MKLKRGIIKTVHELTGYSQKYVNQVAAGEISRDTKARNKVEAAIKILTDRSDEAEAAVIQKMAEIDLLYVKDMKDLVDIPDSFLQEKYKTTDREAIFKKCKERGYF